MDTGTVRYTTDLAQVTAFCSRKNQSRRSTSNMQSRYDDDNQTSVTLGSDESLIWLTNAQKYTEATIGHMAANRSRRK